MQLDEKGTEQEEWCSTQSKQVHQTHGIGMIILGRLFWVDYVKKLSSGKLGTKR